MWVVYGGKPNITTCNRKGIKEFDAGNLDEENMLTCITVICKQKLCHYLDNSWYMCVVKCKYR